MKRLDLLWLAVLIVITGIFVFPVSHELFISLTKAHPYLMGFVKFSILSTMGELLVIRLGNDDWKKPPGVTYRFVVWGLIGMLIVLMFEIFSIGVKGAMSSGLLFSVEKPFSIFWNALMISTIMNLVFAPVFMIAHRFTDTYIDMMCGEGIPTSKIELNDIVERIDWQGFISFVVLKTIPFFWIPAHTITFTVASEYRVLVAAYLSIALGIILSYAKSKKVKEC